MRRETGAGERKRHIEREETQRERENGRQGWEKERQE